MSKKYAEELSQFLTTYEVMVGEDMIDIYEDKETVGKAKEHALNALRSFRFFLAEKYQTKLSTECYNHLVGK